jgi:hypothetical protein
MACVGDLFFLGDLFFFLKMCLQYLYIIFYIKKMLRLYSEARTCLASYVCFCISKALLKKFKIFLFFYLFQINMFFENYLKNYLKNNHNHTPTRCNFQVFVFLCSIYGMIFFLFFFSDYGNRGLFKSASAIRILSSKDYAG